MRDKKRVTNNLVALGSAAVVAVYAAGYVRSAEAAQRFDDESNQRRRPAPDRDAASPAGVAIAGATRDARTTARLQPDTNAVVTALANAAAAAMHDKSGVGVHAPKTAPAPIGSHSTPSASSPVTALPARNAVMLKVSPTATPPVTATATATPPVTATLPVTTTATPPVTATATSPVTTAATLPASTDSSPKAAAKPALPPLPPGVKWRDGSFSGWGTSRHGDIQATVEVDGGKIAYVAVTQCLTQYSCSFFEKLPQQVLDRQSPEVDSVSGATQSANAFYYAIVQALSKAK